MTTQITYGPADRQTSIKLTPGDIVNIESANGAQVLGTFVSLSAVKGVRVHNGRKYVTRRVASIVNIIVGRATELSDEDVAAELPAPAPAPVVEAPAVEAPAAPAAPAVHAADDAAVAEADAPAAPAPVVTDVFDADPIIDGQRLSEMRFPEVMKLAQKYRTPGRGVARIAALREGVAKAVNAETATRIAAAAALREV